MTNNYMEFTLPPGRVLTKEQKLAIIAHAFNLVESNSVIAVEVFSRGYCFALSPDLPPTSTENLTRLSQQMDAYLQKTIYLEENMK